MLPPSGQLSFTDIAKEINSPTSTSLDLNNSFIRTLFNKPSGTISLSDGYSKFFSQSTRFFSPGGFSFTVPPNVTQLTVSYPTPTGMVYTALSVTPGATYSGNIGSIGTSSTFSSITTPTFDVAIASWSGGIDDQFGVELGITSQSYVVYLSTMRGGSGSYSYSNTVPASAITGTYYEVYYSAGAGRNWGNSRIDQQPTAANGWKVRCYMYDSDRSSSGYSFSIALRQVIPIIISWNSIYTYNINIAASTANFDIKSYLQTYTSWDTSCTNCTIDVIVNSGVVMYATPGNYAFNTNSSWPAGTTIRLFNYGTIVGYGGNGGIVDYSTYSYVSSNGSAGGPGLLASAPITIYNYGIISGGGGGGGAGASIELRDYTVSYPGGFWSTYLYEPGGGGGGGNAFGSGGSSTLYSSYPGNNGSAGGLLTGGAGGLGISDGGSFISGNGGAGGSYANAGANGGAASGSVLQYANNIYPPTSGGAGGNAVSGNANITWAVTGTRYGAIY